MEGLPAIPVPEDPETGAIERPQTPPPVQIDEKRLFSNTAQLPVRLQALPNAPIAPESPPSARENSQPPGSKQATPRLPSARDQVLPGSKQVTPRIISPRDEAPSGSKQTTPRAPTIHETPPDQAVITPVLVISDMVPLSSADERIESARPQSARAASLSSKDYKAMAKRASAAAKHDRLAAGSKSLFDANMNDIAALGIGMELYFLLIKYLSWAFLTMGIISLPAIVVNYYGNGVTAKMVDPLQLAYASLGNQGVNPDIASDPSQCLPIGEIDCTGATVSTPFTSDPETVAWIVTSSDAIYSFVFLIVYLLFRRHARHSIDAHQNEHLTPAKYAIYVRGLPSDATSREVLEHFNSRYDPTQEETYYPLWFGCCWGRRPRRVKNSLSKGAVNCNVVSNLDHLWRPDDAALARPARHEEQQMYLGTWIAEVSIAHPTGGLLRTFLAMEVLTRKIADAQALVTILTHEKEEAELVLQNWTPPPGKKNPKKPKSTFKKADERLLQATIKELERLQNAMTKKTSKLKALRKANKQLLLEIKRQEAEEAAVVAAAEPVNEVTPAATATAPGKSKTKSKSKPKSKPKSNPKDEKPLNLNACECAFVVFNNLESRRRCLQDYRRSNKWLLRKFQPKALRFRDGKFPLVVAEAPEPSNILWENLEVTTRSRRLRRSFTNSVTFFLLLLSGAIISAAQSAQQTFKDKAPPAGLCDATLPEVFYASSGFLDASVAWNLEWDSNATCTPGTSGEDRYHVAYSNGIINDITVRNPSSPVSQMNRCTDPCISEKSSTKCNTLACYDSVVREETGQDCQTYLASHVLYCLCTAQLQASIADLGVIKGPRQLWNTFIPCRGFLTDFLAKNTFIVVASAVVVIVNILLKSTLRSLAKFERHTSESNKASAVALKMFAAQFLNTAIIVLVVNAALKLSDVPVVGELFRGKYNDFQRDWYPTVGMGVTMTMLINSIMPHMILLLQMLVISPVKRCLKRRSVRTQDKMDKLYAGPTFDLAVRYPMILNSVFVTLVFCGGSPVLLFIATLACTATFWIDKLSILWLYSVKTAYDEALGETVLGLLPWALIAHLGFSSWMYGNTDLLTTPTFKLTWIFKLFGLSTDGATNTEDMYNNLVAQASKFDPLGQHGFVIKVLHVNVMLMFILFILVLVGMLLSAIWVGVLLPLLRNTIGRVLRAFWRKIRRCCRCRCCCRRKKKNVVKPLHSPTRPESNSPPKGGRSSKVAAEIVLTEIPTSTATAEATSTTTPLSARTPDSARTEVVMPEFTDFFRKSVGPKFRPDAKLGFRRDPDRPTELVRHWKQETISNGYHRKSEDSMRTWEAIQAPVKTYAIEANAKYRLAVSELVAAWKRATTVEGGTPSASPTKPEGASGSTATIPIAIPPVEEEPAKDAEITTTN
ncbi:Transmembrane protein [Phytophthora megakarya]|uniref:Transmembrane protein n=1 Tax=Phytophthora megakarya TaxID=4795 RepID=A0A225W3F9_9STRA|nr:Transmembrane protein [Phytophthora megakarya]